MSKDSKDSAPKIPAAVTEMAKTIRAGISITDGKVTIDPKTYIQTLPEDLSVEQAKKLHSHNEVFYPASVLAFGQFAEDELKANKKLEELSLTIPLIERDTLDLAYFRSQEQNNPSTKSKFTKYGHVEAKLTTQAARNNRGDMSQVRSLLSVQATELFGS